MKLIKIDPAAQTVTTVETSAKLDELCKLIDCRVIDYCARQDNGDVLIVDDEALFLEPQPAAFKFDGYGPLHGVALVAGSDGEGGDTGPQYTIEQILDRVEWLGTIYTTPYVGVTAFEPVGQP